MLEIAICDDDVETVAYIEKLIEDLSTNVNKEVNTEVFFDGGSLINYINRIKKYDLIYLDIEMKHQNGIDVAKEIRKIDKKTLIIYVTSYESFAKEAFEVRAFRFITKPINIEIFKRYFHAALKEIEVQPIYFQYQYNKISYRILIEEIMYFQSDRRVTYIVTEQKNEKCYYKLNDIEKKLCDMNINFYRTHQSFLVNPKYVVKYTYNQMELRDGTTLTISENRRKKVGELFCKNKGEDIIV